MIYSELSRNNFGLCLVATSDLTPGIPVEKFTGEIMSYKDVPESEVKYVLLLDGDRWLVPGSNSRYINHSCSPNCRITSDLVVETTRNVKKGEELTISYNIISSKEYNETPGYFFWDERWSFKCQCGSPNCPGVIDKYIIRD